MKVSQDDEVRYRTNTSHKLNQAAFSMPATISTSLAKGFNDTFTDIAF